mmetsp:Transcript_10894/g.33633  ORF Transcript_10894/g.33633 Transcript_10894/m.33633 type:complete len:334 (-) Transcript_10894:1565-2566(-)
MHAAWIQWMNVRSFAMKSLGKTRPAAGASSVPPQDPGSQRRPGRKGPAPWAISRQPTRSGGARDAMRCIPGDSPACHVRGTGTSAAAPSVLLPQFRVESTRSSGASARSLGFKAGSSIQYGAAWTSSGSSAAQPWMYLENLCTGINGSTMGPTQSGRSSASSRASLSSRTAYGNVAVWSEGATFSRNHRGVMDVEAASGSSPTRDGTSVMSVKFVSMAARTAVVSARLNAARSQMDRTVGTSFFVEMRRCTSSTTRNSFRVYSARAAFVGSYAAFNNNGTSSGDMAKRSFTDSSPAHASRCVLRSIHTRRGSPAPYHRIRSATAPGCFARRPW